MNKKDDCENSEVMSRAEWLHAIYASIPGEGFASFFVACFALWGFATNQLLIVSALVLGLCVGAGIVFGNIFSGAKLDSGLSIILWLGKMEKGWVVFVEIICQMIGWIAGCIVLGWVIGPAVYPGAMKPSFTIPYANAFVFELIGTIFYFGVILYGPIIGETGASSSMVVQWMVTVLNVVMATVSGCMLNASRFLGGAVADLIFKGTPLIVLNDSAYYVPWAIAVLLHGVLYRIWGADWVKSEQARRRGLKAHST